MDEIKSLLDCEGMIINNQVFKDLIGEADENNDGEITFEEFKSMMKKMIY